jgi:hypothetical protein
MRGDSNPDPPELQECPLPRACPPYPRRMSSRIRPRPILPVRLGSASGRPGAPSSPSGLCPRPYQDDLRWGHPQAALRASSGSELSFADDASRFVKADRGRSHADVLSSPPSKPDRTRDGRPYTRAQAIYGLTELLPHIVRDRPYVDVHFLPRCTGRRQGPLQSSTHRLALELFLHCLETERSGVRVRL